MNTVVQVGTLTGLGSGVVIDAKRGLVLTVAHNVIGEKLVYIPIDNKNYEAQIISVDVKHDLALLNAPVRFMQDIDPSLSDTAYKEGDSTWAIGFPRGQVKVGTHGVFKDFGSPIGTIAKTTIEKGFSGGAVISCVDGLFVLKGIIKSQLEATYKDGYKAILPNTTIFVRNNDVHTFLVSTGMTK